MTNGYVGAHFRGAKRDCVPCAHRARCLRTLATTAVRNVAFFHGRVAQPPPAQSETATQRMKHRIDTAEGRRRYAARFGSSSPCSAISATTRGSGASHCGGGRRWMGSGSSSASCTTSRSWPGCATRRSRAGRGGSALDDGTATSAARAIQAHRPRPTTLTIGFSYILNDRNSAAAPSNKMRHARAAREPFPISSYAQPTPIEIPFPQTNLSKTIRLTGYKRLVSQSSVTRTAACTWRCVTLLPQ